MGNEKFITPELQKCLNGKSILGLNGTFTKGGAAKRVYKPTMPVAGAAGDRRSSRTPNKGKGSTGDLSDAGGGSGDQNKSFNGKLTNGKAKGKDKSIKTSKTKGKKELIQLDATFNGINTTMQPTIKAERGLVSPGMGCSSFGPSSSDTRLLRSSQIGSPVDSGPLNGTCVKLEKDSSPIKGNNGIVKGNPETHEVKTEEEELTAERIQRVLYRDDFVERVALNEDNMAPIGWEYVSQHNLVSSSSKLMSFERKESSSSNLQKVKKRYPHGWATTSNEQDKMVLFQLPEMLLNGGVDGLFGKLRVYQSGKMELIDNRSGLVYDLRHTKAALNSLGTKLCDQQNVDEESDEEDDDDRDNNVRNDISKPYREACTFDGQRVVCLGPISDTELLIGQPRLEKFFNL